MKLDTFNEILTRKGYGIVSARRYPVKMPGPAKVKNPKRAKQFDPTPGIFVAAGLPCPVCEYRFNPVRKFRFDYAWVEQKVALESDGGAWTQGRHTRGAGFISDQNKRNMAVIMGWKVLHCTPATLHSGETIAMLKILLFQ